MSSGIIDARVSLLYSLAERFSDKQEWQDIMTYILEHKTASFVELCQDRVKATVWYNELKAINAADVPQGVLEYTGILMSAIDDVLHIESDDEEGY
jgi:hypothetical protein